MKRLVAVCAVIMLTLPAGMCVSTRFVRVPCLSQQDYQKRVEAEPKKVGPELTGDAQRDVRIVGGSAKELRAWGVGNLGILQGCTGS
jgi:hypothetical protein